MWKPLFRYKVAFTKKIRYPCFYVFKWNLFLVVPRPVTSTFFDFMFLVFSFLNVGDYEVWFRKWHPYSTNVQKYTHVLCKATLALNNARYFVWEKATCLGKRGSVLGTSNYKFRITFCSFIGCTVVECAPSVRKVVWVQNPAGSEQRLENRVWLSSCL